ncbi:hypothetical protein [Bacillus sp. FJAT-49736]|uniref:hypothetical protein n=1 Tax=Bacillus sp. FJAT-49736 TaxID=2833582 RepID=UPI001BC97C98|nr:hypothetical protein [Bacillus sp. FJAT-49736]MBS4173704.1 hypothetical protein [Bacillus sp. FJAT-49736]
MTLRIEKKEIILLLLAFILFGSIITILYFKIYQPANLLLDQKKMELKTEKRGYAILQSKVGQINDETYESTLSLQKKVPVKPLTDQLLIQIQKAETISGAEIKEINFNMDENQTDVLQDRYNLDNSSEDQQGKNNASKGTVPNGMQSIPFTLSVKAPTYFEMEEFLNQLQSLSRITDIQKIDFNGPTEEVLNGQADTSIVFHVTASAFYMPSLQDLVDQLPKMDVPSASGKVDPFPNFPNADHQSDGTP